MTYLPARKLIFPGSNDRGHIVFVLSVCLFFVCLLSTITFAITFEPLEVEEEEEENWLFNVTINDILVMHVTAHRCAGGLKRKLDLRSGSQRHRHSVGFFNVPVLAPTPFLYGDSDTPPH